MTNYKEILRLQSLGINNTRIAEACGCACSTVISTLQYANAKGLIETVGNGTGIAGGTGRQRR
jgi:hypothetical protein